MEKQSSMQTSKLVDELVCEMRKASDDPGFQQEVQRSTINNGKPIAQLLKENRQFQQEHPERFAKARQGLYGLS